ncbi:vitamin B12-dependent ribonucleotide reductase [bacterium]|nr:vitamin B12-dependent ribonucleotide reductase [bacterium]
MPVQETKSQEFETDIALELATSFESEADYGYAEDRTEPTSLGESNEPVETEDPEPPANPYKKIQLTDNAKKVLEKRYLKKDQDGRVTETPEQMFRRVARHVASADAVYNPDVDLKSVEDAFYGIMTRFEFMPNSPTLMNAGRELGQLSACFVLPVEDSMESIFDAVKYTALIHKSGGGTGFSFSRIRPKNDIVQTTRGVASGPISFMHVFDEATETVKQGGTRRGANMAILRVDHPDIQDFIVCKGQDDKLNNFNISVAITEKFWKALEEDREYELINPHDKSVAGTLSAKTVFNEILHHAWKNGDPGVIFIDRMNKDNPTPHLGDIESTNPCGEQPLLPYESCNLGSINLSKMVHQVDGRVEIDWEKLSATVRTSVHFLDNVIDVNKYPLEPIAKRTRSTRKIGLGVMGFADLLMMMDIPYDSDTAIETAQDLMRFINDTAKRKSQELGLERGAFPEFQQSVYGKNGEPEIRNSTRTTIAPTGTISIISGCSSGIEPLFALAFYRQVMDNDKLPEIHPHFVKRLKEEGIYTQSLLKKVAENGSCHGIEEIPEHIRRVFVTSHEISPEWHVRMQAAFQNYTDNAVSKTVNFANSATEADIAKVYRLAHDLECKGCTIYRDGSRDVQVLNKGTEESSKAAAKPSEVIPNNLFHPRPRVLNGFTAKLNTGQGSLYVTINTDNQKRPVEVFANIGKSGGDTSALAEAIGRLISITLQKGVSVEEICETMIGITGSRPVWNDGILVKSVPDGIGQILLTEFGSKKSVSHKKELTQQVMDLETGISDGSELLFGPECPECGGIMAAESGCATCHSCGYSHCG